MSGTVPDEDVSGRQADKDHDHGGIHMHPTSIHPPKSRPVLIFPPSRHLSLLPVRRRMRLLVPLALLVVDVGLAQ